MPRIYARFASLPIGPMLLASDGGLTLTTDTDGASLARSARSDVGHNAGTHGAEFTFWGDADLLAAVGIAQPGASLSAMVGGDAAGVGWRLDTGQVFVGNSAVASGLPVVAKGDTVGVRVLLGATPTVEFYKGTTLVHSRAIAVGATWHFAVSIGAPEAATLTAAVNAGQWQGLTPAVLDGGWQPSPAVVPTVRLSDWDCLSAPTDTPPNARAEGLIVGGGLTTLQSLDFWAWGGDASTQGASAQLEVLDADGTLDALTTQDVAGAPVVVRMVDPAGTWADATPVARFVIDRVDINDDIRRTLQLRDAHDDLDEPLTRGVFLPSIPALAWKVQPAVIGAVASVPLLGANSDGSVGWLADAPLASVAAVLDRGDPMEAGTWSLASDGQQILLDQPPVGPVVADASSIGPAQQPATLQQALYEVFRRIDKAAWSSADALAIDTATGYAGIGYYAGDAVTVRQALLAILPSYGASFWQDAEGVLRFGRVVDPDTITELAFELTGDVLAEDIIARPDEAAGLSRRMAYQPNARILTDGELVSDLVDVPVWRRNELTAQWRGQVYSARPLAPRYQHADIAAPLVSCFWRPGDAQAELDRVCGLYARFRQLFALRVPDAHDLDVQPGQVARVTYPRYGLQAGRNLLVRRVQRNPATGEVALTLWG